MRSESFLEGIKQFNQRQFYECHDTLEAIWIEAPETDKRFYQGILQIAVACHHLSNINIRGAMILLGEGINRLSDYQPDYYTIDVSELLEESLSLLQKLQQLKSEEIDSFVQNLFSSPRKPNQIEEEIKLPILVVLPNDDS